MAGYTMRTKFKNGVVAEFFAPKDPSTKVVILCGGMPSMPDKKTVLEFFVKKGFWVFFPRYKGTWESAGEFLVESPEQGILEIINEITLGFKDGFSEVFYEVNPEEVYVIGSSFGGTVALMCARDARVKKVVALSPVVDWEVPSEAEPVDILEKQIKNAFGEAYRFSSDNWKKLMNGDFFSPVKNKAEIDGKEVLIYHTKNDKIVNFKPVERFAKDIGAEFILKEKGGHLSITKVTSWRYWRKIKKFLK
jgi:esterase/lipase